MKEINAHALNENTIVAFERELEICICAAIRCTDGTIIRGHQHRDCRDGAIRRGKQPKKAWDAEGFITSQNRYVDREEGYKLMQAIGWKSKNPQGYQLCGWLYSEDFI